MHYHELLTIDKKNMKNRNNISNLALVRKHFLVFKEKHFNQKLPCTNLNHWSNGETLLWGLICFKNIYFLSIYLHEPQDINICCLLYYQDPLLGPKDYKRKLQLKLGVFVYNPKCRLLKATCTSFIALVRQFCWLGLSNMLRCV